VRAPPANPLIEDYEVVELNGNGVA
jgi:hypothetical protein